MERNPCRQEQSAMPRARVVGDAPQRSAPIAHASPPRAALHRTHHAAPTPPRARGDFAAHGCLTLGVGLRAMGHAYSVTPRNGQKSEKNA